MKYTLWLIAALVLCGQQGYTQEVEDKIFDKERKVGGLNERWELTPSTKNKTFTLTPYKQVYLLPGRWTDRPNEMPTSLSPDNNATKPIDYNKTEIRFQISFKTKVATGLLFGKGDLWLAFTQTANWQAYNEPESRPFRELNYEPEIIFNYPLDLSIHNFKLKMVGVGFNHQSNGKGLPLSRSWNRVTMHVAGEYENWTFMAKPWIRIGEDILTDDNPDLSDYVGRAEFTVGYQEKSGQLFTLMVRNNLRFNSQYKGFVEFTWAYPIRNNLKAFLVANHGYGETLVDYNWKQTTIGIGVSLVEWM